MTRFRPTVYACKQNAIHKCGPWGVSDLLCGPSRCLVLGLLNNFFKYVPARCPYVMSCLRAHHSHPTPRVWEKSTAMLTGQLIWSKSNPHLLQDRTSHDVVLRHSKSIAIWRREQLIRNEIAEATRARKRTKLTKNLKRSWSLLKWRRVYIRNDNDSNFICWTRCIVKEGNAKHDTGLRLPATPTPCRSTASSE